MIDGAAICQDGLIGSQPLRLQSFQMLTKQNNTQQQTS